MNKTYLYICKTPYDFIKNPALNALPKQSLPLCFYPVQTGTIRRKFYLLIFFNQHIHKMWLSCFMIVDFCLADIDKTQF